MPLVEWFELKHVDGPDGSICIAESEIDVPFAIRRVYYLHGVPAGHRRGRHAHKNLQQLAIAVKGSCRFHLDDGRATEDVTLDDPHRGILIRNMLWREMYDFSQDCVLMVLASEHFDEADYIRDYEEFRNAVASR